MNIRRKFALAVGLIFAVLTASTAFSATGVETHWTPGNTGTHSTTSHPNNPAHGLIGVGASHTGTISSGGQYHDHCLNGPPCVAGFNGDFAADIGAGAGGQGITLNLGWLGTAGDVNQSETPDLSKSVSISAVLDSDGNFRGSQVFGDSAHPACNWQSYKVLLSYTSTAGAIRTDLEVGRVWFAHLDAATVPYRPTTRIDPNVSATTAQGGRIRTISGVPIGYVYKGGDGGDCSNGSHIHMEFLSKHAYGEDYEWHSGDAANYGPDGYYLNGQNGSDWYKGWATTDYPNTRYYPNPGAYDSVSQGQTMGFLGGGATSFYMVDNPNTGDH